MGRELQKWAEPPKWGGVSSRKDFHHWLWLQPIVIDLHFKIKLYKLNIVSSLSKIKYAIKINIFRESRAQSLWSVVFGPEFEHLLHDIKGNHPRALLLAVPEQRRGKILLYRFVLSNGGVPGLEIRRVGWGSDAGCN